MRHSACLALAIVCPALAGFGEVEESPPNGTVSVFGVERPASYAIPIGFGLASTSTMEVHNGHLFIATTIGDPRHEVMRLPIGNDGGLSAVDTITADPLPLGAPGWSEYRFRTKPFGLAFNTSGAGYAADLSDQGNPIAFANIGQSVAGKLATFSVGLSPASRPTVDRFRSTEDGWRHHADVEYVASIDQFVIVTNRPDPSLQDGRLRHRLAFFDHSADGMALSHEVLLDSDEAYPLRAIAACLVSGTIAGRLGGFEATEQEALMIVEEQSFFDRSQAIRFASLDGEWLGRSNVEFSSIDIWSHGVDGIEFHEPSQTLFLGVSSAQAIIPIRVPGVSGGWLCALLAVGRRGLRRQGASRAVAVGIFVSGGVAAAQPSFPEERPSSGTVGAFGFEFEYDAHTSLGNADLRTMQFHAGTLYLPQPTLGSLRRIVEVEIMPSGGLGTVETQTWIDLALSRPMQWRNGAVFGIAFNTSGGGYGAVSSSEGAPIAFAQDLFSPGIATVVSADDGDRRVVSRVDLVPESVYSVEAEYLASRDQFVLISSGPDTGLPGRNHIISYYDHSVDGLTLTGRLPLDFGAQAPFEHLRGACIVSGAFASELTGTSVGDAEVLLTLGISGSDSFRRDELAVFDLAGSLIASSLVDLPQMVPGTGSLLTSLEVHEQSGTLFFGSDQIDQLLSVRIPAPSASLAMICGVCIAARRRR